MPRIAPGLFYRVTRAGVVLFCLIVFAWGLPAAGADHAKIDHPGDRLGRAGDPLGDLV